MKNKFLQLFIIVFGLMITFTSCENSSTVEINELDKSTNLSKTTLSKSDIEAMSCGESKVVSLVAGQHIDVGTVTVSNDDTNLYVMYETTGDWYLTEAHLYVGAESGIPLTKKGNPKIGHFPHHTPDDFEASRSLTFTLPLEDLDDCFVVVAHAVVDEIVNGETMSSETAFGCGDKEFPGKRWGCYFDYCKEECEEECFDLFGRKENEFFATCLNVDINGTTLKGWSSRARYQWLLDYKSQDHYLEVPIYINGDECDLNSGTQIGRVEFAAGENGKDFEVSYVIYPYDYSNYEITEINLYAGSEENPYNTDGTLKDGITNANFYSETFDTPVKRTNVITLPYSGEIADVFIIPHLKVCEMEN